MGPSCRAARLPGFSLGGVFLGISALLCGGFLFSCGSSSGGGSAGSVEALTLPSRIELTKADDGSTASASLTPNSGFGDPDTDYSKAEKHSYVEDTDALNMINGILQVVKDSGYKYFVNQGPYAALVTSPSDSDQAQSGNTTTSTTTEDLEEMVLDVSRASNTAPMVVKLWAVEEDGPGGNRQLVKAYFEVTQGVSDDYPLGEMEAFIKGLKLDSSGQVVPGDPLFRVALKISADNGVVTVQSLDYGQEDEGGMTFEWNHRLRLRTNQDLSEGQAYVISSETDHSSGALATTSLRIAFNSDYFRTKNIESGQVQVFNKKDLVHRVHNYKLFDKDTGAEVKLAGGFPVAFPGGKTGYVGYYGIWAPAGVTPTSGMKVTRVGSGEEYTLFGVRGKLTRHSKATVTLGDITGAEIFVWDETNHQDNIVAWNGSGFVKLGTRDQQGQVTYLGTPTAYTFSNTWDGGWCDALKAWLPLGTLTSPDNGTVVPYHTDQTVFPSQAQNLTLYFFGFALDAPITQSVIDGASVAMNSYWSNPTKKTYYFDAANMVLREGGPTGEPVILGADLDLSNSGFSNGYTMDPLTTNSSFTTSNWSGIYDEDTFYSWSTGPQDWNQFWTVKDSTGSYVAFDPPIRLKYTHQTANDLNGDSTYDGKLFSMEYDGNHLDVPGKYDAQAEEWVPLFNLKDGTVLQAADGASVEYVVKGVEESLVMRQVTDPTVLSALETSLPFDETLDAPDIVFDETKSALVGDMPTGVTLKVIKGELVSGS